MTTFAEEGLIEWSGVLFRWEPAEVVLALELNHKPVVLIAAQSIQGLDVGATEFWRSAKVKSWANSAETPWIWNSLAFVRRASGIRIYPQKDQRLQLNLEIARVLSRHNKPKTEAKPEEKSGF
jgi:hypothetical protein